MNDFTEIIRTLFQSVYGSSNQVEFVQDDSPDDILMTIDFKRYDTNKNELVETQEFEEGKQLDYNTAPLPNSDIFTTHTQLNRQQFENNLQKNGTKLAFRPEGSSQRWDGSGEVRKVRGRGSEQQRPLCKEQNGRQEMNQMLCRE